MEIDLQYELALVILKDQSFNITLVKKNNGEIKRFFLENVIFKIAFSENKVFIYNKITEKKTSIVTDGVYDSVVEIINLMLY